MLYPSCMLSSLFVSLWLGVVAPEGGLEQVQPATGNDDARGSGGLRTSRVLPAAVVILKSGAEIPEVLSRRGRPLGESKRSWLVEAESGESGLSLADEARGWLGVESASPDMLLAHVRHAVTFDDPWFSAQWYHETLGTEALYDMSLGEPSIRVAVIDSATDITHPDLEAGVVASHDVRDGDEDPSPVPGDFCFGTGDETTVCDEHGTAVSGIIGARANNAEGVVGICPGCSLIPIRMIGEVFTALSLDVEAFEKALDSGAAVINNSWGYGEATAVPDAMRSVIERATREGRDGLGVVVIFAAGNEDRVVLDDELSALDTVLSVSAVDRYGNPTPYTNSGDSVDLAAPSATVSTGLGGGYTTSFGGTSAAAPVVAGLAGWLLSVRPELTAAEVRSLLIKSARPDPRVSHDETGHHPVFGYGVVDAERLVGLLEGETNPEPSISEEDATGGDGGCQSVVGAWWWLTLMLIRIRRVGPR